MTDNGDDTGGPVADDPNRQLELDRLDRMQVELWDRAHAGDLDAFDRLLVISDRRCRLLGLYLQPEDEAAEEPKWYRRAAQLQALAEIEGSARSYAKAGFRPEVAAALLVKVDEVRALMLQEDEDEDEERD